MLKCQNVQENGEHKQSLADGFPTDTVDAESKDTRNLSKGRETKCILHLLLEIIYALLYPYIQWITGTTKVWKIKTPV